MKRLQLRRIISGPGGPKIALFDGDDLIDGQMSVVLFSEASKATDVAVRFHFHFNAAAGLEDCLGDEPRRV